MVAMVGIRHEITEDKEEEEEEEGRYSCREKQRSP